MGLLDIFKNDAFGALELSDAFMVKPNKYGRLQELNLFPAKGVRTREVAIERKNGVLNLLPTVPVGGPATKGSVGKRDLRKVEIPHIPHEDMISAADVQGVRSFGTENMLQSVQELVLEKMDTMSDKHDITLEYLRWGALAGKILDADGTSILNLFAEFNTAEEVESFGLNSGSTQVMTSILNLKRYMELNLLGDSMTGIKVFCSPGFFDALTTHASVIEAYKFYQSNQGLNLDLRTRFVHGGVDFEEHNGRATDINGNVIKFIADNEARVVPMGSQSMRTYFAPADFIETVNTPGLPRYAKQRITDYERGVEIHTQSNPLPICLRPQLLVRLTK